MLLQIPWLNFLNVWVVFHSVCVYRHIQHPLYPFICRWTSRLFPCLGYWTLCCYEHRGAWIFFLVFSFIFINWRLITLHIVVGFAIHWHELAMDLHVFPILTPPPTSLPIRSLWVFPVHQHRALVSCIQPRLAICFTLDNIHVSMQFSQIIPPSLSPIKSKSLFYTSVSLFPSCI